MNKSKEDYIMRMYAPLEVSLTPIKTHNTLIFTQEYGKLVDFQSGCWATVIGHNRIEIVETIKEHVENLLHTHHFFETEHPSALVKEIIKGADIAGNYKGTFLSSGTESVSLAISLAKVLTKRKRKLSFTISYHGASPNLRLPRDQDLWHDINITPCLTCETHKDCKTCTTLSTVDFPSYSAFVFEPGNSGSLVLCPPEKLIKYLATEIRQTGGYVIVNEVTTGFGRTGKWFGFQHYRELTKLNMTPDFIAMGKGLGNGYPISGLLIKSSLSDVLEDTDYRYVQSHINDPLGCIIARKVVEIMLKENLIQKGNETGHYLRERLHEINGVTEIRGRGLMNIIILDKKISAKKVFTELLNKGNFVGYSEAYNSIGLYPPLTISTKEIDSLCQSLRDILNGNRQ